MKYFCEVEGYDECYIDVVDSWTMKELRALTDSDDKEYFEIFKKKVDSMLLKDSDGNELRDPKKIDDAFIENVDVSLAGFIGSVLALHVRQRKSLGGMSVRPQSTISEIATMNRKQ